MFCDVFFLIDIKLLMWNYQTNHGLDTIHIVKYRQKLCINKK